MVFFKCSLALFGGKIIAHFYFEHLYEYYIMLWHVHTLWHCLLFSSQCSVLMILTCHVMVLACHASVLSLCSPLPDIKITCFSCPYLSPAFICWKWWLNHSLGSRLQAHINLRNYTIIKVPFLISIFYRIMSQSDGWWVIVCCHLVLFFLCLVVYDSLISMQSLQVVSLPVINCLIMMPYISLNWMFMAVLFFLFLFYCFTSFMCNKVSAKLTTVDTVQWLVNFPACHMINQSASPVRPFNLGPVGL